jgi:hypothetical protein
MVYLFIHLFRYSLGCVSHSVSASIYLSSMLDSIPLSEIFIPLSTDFWNSFLHFLFHQHSFAGVTQGL